MPSRTRWKWGILFGGDNLSMADLLRYGKMADRCGADSVWTAEVWRDAFVPLTAMASVVQRARVGTAIRAVCALPLAHRDERHVARRIHRRTVCARGGDGPTGMEREMARAPLPQAGDPDAGVQNVSAPCGPARPRARSTTRAKFFHVKLCALYARARARFPSTWRPSVADAATRRVPCGWVDPAAP
jgi:hypothetical protein